MNAINIPNKVGGMTCLPQSLGVDTELQHLVNISGLKEEFIAAQNNITPQYFSMLKTSARVGLRKRLAIKIWLIQYIRHSLTFKLAA